MSSYWIDSTKNINQNNPIDNDYIADVCIIGAGICGLSTGYYLAKNGLKVIIIDKDTIGKKTSGNTTAKITLQHNLIYDYLINSFGKEFSKGYFESNKKAISEIKEIIDSENISCDFEYQSNYVYTTDKNEVEKIQNEVDSLNELAQEKIAQFITNCALPLKIIGGIKIENQAQFHPVKYMYGLSNAIKNNGGLIFTNSLVKDIDKEDNEYVSYTDEYKIKSKYLVMTSHYPFINFPRILFF